MTHPLFSPERHEALLDEPWDPAAVERALADIVRDVTGAAQGGTWPGHPLEDGGADAHTLYMGAAGILWGLEHLAREGAVELDPRLAGWAAELPERYLAAPDTGAVVPSYFLGESGVLLAALRFTRRREWADRLFVAARSNVEHPARELLWGAPGTGVAAALAHELTGEEQFRELYVESAEALLRTWQRHEGDEIELWTQDLYGQQRRLLGAAHGFAGNVSSLLRGLSLLPAALQRAIVQRATTVLRATALWDDGAANWPPLPGSQQLLLQWCHGAPGIVTSFGRAPRDPELDALLAAGGETVWRAGPLRKGSNLCHGTAGNGAAFLTLFERSGDELWLTRARRFAMHAIRQTEGARAAYGQGRYSLWTGDVGTAVYLQACLEGASDLPTIDRW